MENHEYRGGERGNSVFSTKKGRFIYKLYENSVQIGCFLLIFSFS
jgi:hypothetical protein